MFSPEKKMWDYWTYLMIILRASSYKWSNLDIFVIFFPLHLPCEPIWFFFFQIVMSNRIDYILFNNQVLLIFHIFFLTCNVLLGLSNAVNYFCNNFVLLCLPKWEDFSILVNMILEFFRLKNEFRIFFPDDYWGLTTLIFSNPYLL